MKNKILAFVLALGLFYCALSFTIDFFTFDKKMYISSYKRYNVDLITDKNANELNKITDDIMAFIKSGDIGFLKKDFNEKEISHMRDVYNIYRVKNILTYAFLAIIIIIGVYAWSRGSLYKCLFFTRNFLLAFLSVFLIGLIAYVIFGFQQIFILFHEVLFDNENWMLDPDTSLMINMLPEQFFMKMGLYIALVSFVAVCAFVIAISAVIIRMERKHGKGSFYLRERA